MNVYDRVIPNKSYQTLWVLSIGVIIAILFEFTAKMLRGRLTDIAGKKADLIISSALFRKVTNLKLQENLYHLAPMLIIYEILNLSVIL